jgi:hypothetical protein
MRKTWLFAAIAALLLAVGVTGVATAGGDRHDRDWGDKGERHDKGFDGNRFRAKLKGYQENPPISTPARGRFAADIESDGIHFTLSYSVLEGGAATAAHIHFAPPRVNGGIVVTLCGGTKPACPASGEVTGVITPADVGLEAQGIPPGGIDELIAAMRHGLTYVNVHNATFPNGEIRGQIHGKWGYGKKGWRH